jgi:hypothetical protein
VDTSSQGDTTQEQDALGQMLRDFEENYKDRKMYDKYVCMIEDSEIPMYRGSKPHYTKLVTVL